VAKTNFEAMRDRLYQRAGLLDIPKPTKPAKEIYQDLLRSEWSPKFEELMRNRLVIGSMRYGLLHAPNKPAYDRIAGARKRLQQFESTGNLECLVDIANMMLLEFEEGRHPKRHWSDITGDHCCV